MARGKSGGSIKDRQGIWKGSLCKEMALPLMIMTEIHLEKRDWNWEKFWNRFDQLLWRVRCVCVCVSVCWDVSKIILSLRLLARKNEQMVTPWVWEEMQGEDLSFWNQWQIHFFKKFYLFIYFNWMLITLQYCSGFCHTLTWISHGCTYVPHPETPSHLPRHPIPQGHPSAPALSTLFHASNLDWQSISHMVIYMFQCYSLKSSHPRLLP